MISVHIAILFATPLSSIFQVLKHVIFIVITEKISFCLNKISLILEQILYLAEQIYLTNFKKIFQST